MPQKKNVMRAGNIGLSQVESMHMAIQMPHTSMPMPILYICVRICRDAFRFFLVQMSRSISAHMFCRHVHALWIDTCTYIVMAYVVMATR